MAKEGYTLQNVTSKSWDHQNYAAFAAPYLSILKFLILSISSQNVPRPYILLDKNFKSAIFLCMCMYRVIPKEAI